MLFDVRHANRDVTVRFERCGGLDERHILECDDGRTVSVYRRGSRWVLAVLRGDSARYYPPFMERDDALHAAAVIYLNSRFAYDKSLIEA